MDRLLSCLSRWCSALERVTCWGPQAQPLFSVPFVTLIPGRWPTLCRLHSTSLPLNQSLAIVCLFVWRRSAHLRSGRCHLNIIAAWQMTREANVLTVIFHSGPPLLLVVMICTTAGWTKKRCDVTQYRVTLCLLQFRRRDGSLIIKYPTGNGT